MPVAFKLNTILNNEFCHIGKKLRHICTTALQTIQQAHGEDKETPIHECLNAEKLLAMAGNSLTFFRVPLRNSLYWSDRR